MNQEDYDFECGDGYMNEQQRSMAGLAQDILYYGSSDEELCPCNGSGWVLSNLDVWVECPHHRGRQHPEDYHCDDEPQDCGDDEPDDEPEDIIQDEPQYDDIPF